MPQSLIFGNLVSGDDVDWGEPYYTLFWVCKVVEFCLEKSLRRGENTYSLLVSTSFVMLELASSYLCLVLSIETEESQIYLDLFF